MLMLTAAALRACMSSGTALMQTAAHVQISMNRGTAGLSTHADGTASGALELLASALHSLRWRFRLTSWRLQRCVAHADS